jgi:UPF0755 protein
MFSRKALKALFWMLFLVVALFVAAGGFYLGYSYVVSQNTRFEEFSTSGANVGPDTAGAEMVVIPRASNTKEIAALLADQKIVKNPFLFTLLSKVNGFDGQYQAGTHFVTKSMTYDEIMYMLSQKPKSVRVTFPEGLTYKQIKDKLKTAGVYFDEAKLDAMVQNPSQFIDYKFVRGIEVNPVREWNLQGYLFPDTYEFDMNADEKTIIRTFLDNTEDKFLPEFYARAEVMGLTMDQVVTLASIVQSETAVLPEMGTVASVFWNRLRYKDPASRLLQSCAVLNYLREQQNLPRRIVATDEDIKFDSPYNTYQYAGLPPGAICNPGADAIRATLWPDQTKYLYFVAKGDGTTAFAESFAQHEINVAKYVK